MQGLGAYGIPVSGPGAQALTFYRSKTTFENGEERRNFQPFLDVTADVQPNTNPVVRLKYVEVYESMYDVYVSGSPDIQGKDRCVIDGLECEVVQSPNRFGDHLELMAGSMKVRAAEKPGG